MTRRIGAMLLGVAALGGIACAERTPTSLDPDRLPAKPTSVEVILGWEEFGSNLQVFGGYGAVYEVGTGMVARAFEGVLDARTLVRFFPLATSASVTDATGTSVTDTLLSLRGGRVVAFVDAAASVAPGPVTFELGTVPQRWHAASASWAMAVDTLGERIPWDEPGAGPLERLATAVWDPSRGDSVVFFLDTASLKLLRDTSDVRQGALLGLVTPGARLKVNSVALRATVQASLADTLLELTSTREALTFLYTPEPAVPGGALRVGGAPAWRTTLHIAVPPRLTGPPSLCALAGCPVELTAERVNYAALVLSARSTQAAFRPADSLGIDARPVFDPATLPKSPLGSGLIGGYGKMLAPDLFGTDEGAQVDIPITSFVRLLLQGDTVGGFPPPSTLALLSALEPSSLTFASFFGAGSPRAPKLKLIVSTVRPVELP